MTDREVIRCSFCGLNQFMTRSGLCRKPDCGKPLKPLIRCMSIPDSVKSITVIAKGGDSYGAGGKDGSVDITCHIGADAPLLPSENFYRPEFTGCLSRAEALILKEILPVSRVVDQIVSNVRRKEKQPRYNREYLSLPGFPTELRLRCLQYAKEKGMSLRDVVIKAVEKLLDGE